jgi:acyl-CoA thioesterase
VPGVETLPSDVTHPFEVATAVWPDGPSRWRTPLDADWFGSAAPHGGHLAAQLLRAMQGEVQDAELAARSLTVHFLSAGQPGELEVETRVERAGRSLTALSARATQEGRLVAVALGQLGRARRGPDLLDVEPPDLAEPDASPAPSERARALRPPVMQHYEMRFGFGAPRSGEPPRSGGWLRPLHPRAGDDLLTTALTDTWMPSMYVALEDPVPTTTVELTINFLAPSAGLPPELWYLAAFQTVAASDGYYREEGEIWAHNGALLARCSQLGVFLGGREPRSHYHRGHGQAEPAERPDSVS